MRPGPLEQPHHKQLVILPDQLLPDRDGVSALSGVRFIIRSLSLSHPSIPRPLSSHPPPLLLVLFCRHVAGALACCT